MKSETGPPESYTLTLNLSCALIIRHDVDDATAQARKGSSAHRDGLPGLAYARRKGQSGQMPTSTIRHNDPRPRDALRRTAAKQMTILIPGISHQMPVPPPTGDPRSDPRLVSCIQPGHDACGAILAAFPRLTNSRASRLPPTSPRHLSRDRHPTLTQRCTDVIGSSGRNARAHGKHDHASADSPGGRDILTPKAAAALRCPSHNMQQKTLD